MNPNKVFYCQTCERDSVLCGACGNNVCNGGAGQVDGKRCEQCEQAYQQDLPDIHKTMIRAVKGEDGAWE